MPLLTFNDFSVDQAEKLWILTEFKILIIFKSDYQKFASIWMQIAAKA